MGFKDRSVSKSDQKFGFSFDRRSFNPERVLMGYADASFANEEKHSSRWGVLFYLGGCLVHWASSKTSRIVTSSTEAEVHSLVHFGKENVWQREFHQVLGFFENVAPTLVRITNRL